MKINRLGVTRLVFLTKKYAIKIPNFTYSWRHFLYGLVANIKEKQIWNICKVTENQHLLCPIVWASWGGWIVVMKKVKPCDYYEFKNVDITPWKTAHLAGDDTSSNYGWIDNRLVKLDYGHLDSADVEK